MKRGKWGGNKNNDGVEVSDGASMAEILSEQFQSVFLSSSSLHSICDGPVSAKSVKFLLSSLQQATYFKSSKTENPRRLLILMAFLQEYKKSLASVSSSSDFHLQLTNENWGDSL